MAQINHIAFFPSSFIQVSRFASKVRNLVPISESLFLSEKRQQLDNFTMVRFNNLCFLLILGFLLSTSESVRFDLESGQTKCIAEDIKSNSMTVGKYSVVNPDEAHPLPDTHKVTVRVIFFLPICLCLWGFEFDMTAVVIG